jgi:hypothetical protein
MNKLIIFLLLFTKIALAQDDWKLSTEKDGISLYTAAASNSKIKPIKVECTFNATASQLVAVLLDIKNYTAWVYHTKSSALVKEVSPAELYYYGELNVPWPAQNRDFVAHVTIVQNPETKVITVDAPQISGMVPSKENTVRMTNSKGKWIITPIANDKVKVVYYLQMDPGGSTPAWRINMFAA